MTNARGEERGANVRFPPPWVFIGFIGVGLLLQWLCPVAMHVGLVPRLMVGGSLIACALGIGASAIVWFRRTGQNPKPWEPSPELIVRGIYRRTRNPMYLGMTMFQLGIGALLGNIWIIAFAMVSLTIVHLIAVRPEEDYLTERFGDAYLQYKSRVRRYL